MDGEFDIPVTYKGEEILFPAKLLAYGYTHKIEVDVEGIKIIFEPDEEKNYRATTDAENTSKINLELVKLIAETLQQIVK